MFFCAPATLTFGQQFHEAILEPEVYEMNKYLPEYQKNKSQIAKLVRAIRENQVFMTAFNNPKKRVEVPIEFELDEFPGLKYKGKLDLPVPPSILDPKTTSCGSYSSFEESCKKYGYFRQMALYMDGYNSLAINSQKITKSILIGVEKAGSNKTYTVIRDIDHPDIIEGRYEYRDLTRKYLQMTEITPINFKMYETN